MIDTNHGNRTQAAATQLRQMIVAGELSPGQKISEREIVESLNGVSRTPLREAFKILAAEGLLTISPNRGATVTALSMDEVQQTIEFLVGLEGLAAQQACIRITDQEIDKIDALHRQMRSAYEAEQLMEYFEINQAIHLCIVNGAKNDVTSRIYAAECSRIRRYRYAGNRRHDRWDAAIAEHEHMLSALKTRNGPLLREMIHAHHNNGWLVTKGLLAAELSKP